MYVFTRRVALAWRPGKTRAPDPVAEGLLQSPRPSGREAGLRLPDPVTPLTQGPRALTSWTDEPPGKVVAEPDEIDSCPAGGREERFPVGLCNGRLNVDTDGRPLLVRRLELGLKEPGPLRSVA